MERETKLGSVRLCARGLTDVSLLLGLGFMRRVYMAANSMSKKRRRPAHICCSDKGVGSSRESGGTLKCGTTRKVGRRETGRSRRRTETISS